MEDPTTIALNLTFLGTLGVAFVMFVGLFAVFVATLVTAGLGRLVALIITAIAVRLSRASGAATRALQPQLPTPVRTARKEAPQLSADWTAAVARADERAAFRLQAEAAPDSNGPPRTVPPAAPGPATSGGKSLRGSRPAGTEHGRRPQGTNQRPAPAAQQRKAG